jgi:hypothetical protein
MTWGVSHERGLGPQLGGAPSMGCAFELSVYATIVELDFTGA